MKRAALLAAAVVLITACGDDTPPSPSPTVIAVVASGALTATYPRTETNICTLKANTLDLLVDGTHGVPPLHMQIHAFHGAGTYTGLTGTAGTGGVTIVATSTGGATWVAGTGDVVVTTSAYTLVTGTMNVSMHPNDNVATGTVDLAGDWRCTIGSRPSPTASATATPRT